MSARAVLSEIGDQLSADTCLTSLLDPLDTNVQHGSLQFCDQPPNSHTTHRIARFQQGTPGDFIRACVRFGGISRGEIGPEQVRNLEAWTFRVSGFAHQQIEDGGELSPGDLWLEDVRDAVIRVLAWKLPGQTECSTTDPFVIWQKFHDGTVLPTEFDANKAVWTFQEQFRWVVLSRGVIPPLDAAGCC